MENQTRHQATRRQAIKALSATAALSLAGINESVAFENTKETTPYVLKNSEFRDEYQFWGMNIFLKVGAKDSNDQLSLFYGTYHKNDGPPLHVHHDQDEQFYILEGEFLVQVGKDKYTLRAGDTIFLPREIPHTFLVTSDTAKMLFQTQPSGKIEGLFKYLANNYKTATPEEIGKAMAQFNHSFIGPPLSAK